MYILFTPNQFVILVKMAEVTGKSYNVKELRNKITKNEGRKDKDLEFTLNLRKGDKWMIKVMLIYCDCLKIQAFTVIEEQVRIKYFAK